MPDLMPQPKRTTASDYYVQRQRRARRWEIIKRVLHVVLLVGSGALLMFIWYCLR